MIFMLPTHERPEWLVAFNRPNDLSVLKPRWDENQHQHDQGPYAVALA